MRKKAKRQIYPILQQMIMRKLIRLQKQNHLTQNLIKKKDVIFVIKKA